MSGLRNLARRMFVGAALAAATLLPGCRQSPEWQLIDVDGLNPALDFEMQRGGDGQKTTADDYRGQIVLLLFGYTFCPDICPTMLSKLSRAVEDLGPDKNKVSILFVTVDPGRDTVAVLGQYARAFSPRVIGLRGTGNQLALLARDYRVAYSVKPSEEPAEYEVTHTGTVHVFDGTGRSRLLITSSATTDQIGSDLRQLIAEQNDERADACAAWHDPEIQHCERRRHR